MDSPLLKIRFQMKKKNVKKATEFLYSLTSFVNLKGNRPSFKKDSFSNFNPKFIFGVNVIWFHMSSD
jgi:hypothetical protein